MFRHKLISALLLIVLSTSSALAQADAPLILWVRGDLYAVSDLTTSPVQLTQNGTISGPTLSPDGNMIAYKAAASIGLQALDRVQATGFIAEFDLPGDIYMLNVAAQQTVLVAGQPDDASLFVEGVPDNAIVRSSPAWSPDNAMLAWTELDFGEDSTRLITFDFATRTQSAIANNLPIEVVGGTAPDVRWGTGGIAIIGDASELLIYDTDGTLLSTPQLTPQEDENPQEYAWIEGDDQSLFGVLYSSGRWSLYDPLTGIEQQTTAEPLLVGTAENALALRFGALPDVGIFWETVDSSGATTASGAFPTPPSRVTLSPSGREVAFIGYPDFGGVAVWRNGEIIPVSGTGSNDLAVGAILWGATAWRMSGG
ncbi:MAG TPA: hypothetical protein VK003_16865 [Oceanobacillus sp.]|nr:hypothetical protein [Oceanobacillus sp.]